MEKPEDKKIDEEEQDEEYSEDETEYSEDEEEEEEDYRSRKKKKQKKTSFIDAEAAVDDSDDEEEYSDEEEDYKGRGRMDAEEEEARKMQEEIYARIDRRRAQEASLNEDVDEHVRRLKEKYSRQAYADGAYGAGGEYVQSEAVQQYLLPTPSDPLLWMVKCREGKERDICLGLLRKSISFKEKGAKFPVFSCITRDSLKGYLYIEARSESDVLFALDKVNNVYLQKITLVPREEMTSVLTISSSATSGAALRRKIQIGSFVRLKRGKYKNDIGQVVELSETSADSVRIKLVPRLDYNAPASQSGAFNGANKKRAIKQRPPQKLFNPKEIPKNANDKTFMKRGSRWQYGNDIFDHDGYLERVVRLNAIDYIGVKPTLEELSKFNAAELSALSIQDSSVADGPTPYEAGDRVVVIRGELMNAVGVVKSVTDKDGIIVDLDEGLRGVSVDRSFLRLFLVVGDSVRVVRGRYIGEQGMITQIKDDVLTMFSSTSMQQISVFVRDVVKNNTSSVDVSALNQQQNSSQLSDIKSNELCMLSNAKVGVVIHLIDATRVKFLDFTGNVSVVNINDITQKMDSSVSVSVDEKQRPIKDGDLVHISSGVCAGKQGNIVHLFRSYAFVQVPEYAENNGLIVVRTHVLSLRSNGSASQLLPQNALKAVSGFQFSKFRHLTNKTVIITAGPYKGYQGVVRDISKKGARVELHTNAKTVYIDPAKIMLQSEVPRQTPVASGWNSSQFDGGKTPAQMGSMTPYNAMGSKTPAWDVGAKTPAVFATRYREEPLNSATAASGSGSAGGNLPSADYGSSSITAANTLANAMNGDRRNGAEIPATEDNGATGSQGDGSWVLVGCEVTVSSTKQTGRVSEITEKEATVVINTKKHKYARGDLRPVLPQKGKIIIIDTTDYRGMIGNLVSVEADTDEAIVKLDSNSEFKIMPLASVCKYLAE